jgi:Domain of unknown function (DUF6438)/Ankyrin repeats (3 copies)
MLHLVLAVFSLLNLQSAASLPAGPAPAKSGNEQAGNRPKQMPFPAVHDWNSVAISLHRSGCYSICPTYVVEVHGNGEVFYEGYAAVAFTGHHRASVSQANVLELLRLFERADFFSLRDRYMAPISDHPTFTTSIEIEGVRKQVDDYAGRQAGMPAAVSELEDAIDRLAGAERWTKGIEEPGKGDTISALVEEHWDFHSPEAADTLARVAEMGNAALVHQLIALGTPLTGRVGYSIEIPPEDRGLSALELAARRGDLEMLRSLLQAGAGWADTEKSQGDRSLDRALVLAAQSGSTPSVQLLLQAGAAVSSRPDRGGDVLVSAVRSGVPGVVAALLDWRPDLNAPASDGRTALAEAVAQLRAASATRNAAAQVARSGERAVDRAEVVRMLLAAGAVE